MEARLTLLVAGLALAVVIFVKSRGGIVETGKGFLSLIKKFEGFAAHPYDDPPGSGKKSVGWGHQITPGENFNYPMSMGTASALLDRDSVVARNAVARHVSVTLTGAQHDALISFVYNIGETQFVRGTVPKKINAGDLPGAGRTMLLYNKAGGVVNAGLVKRRTIEAAPFLKV